MVLIASPGRLVAFVGVDAERHVRPDRGADAPHHLDVALRIDADLDLDRADALGRDLRGLALALLDGHQADRMGDRDRVAHRAAEQHVDRHAAGAAGEIVGRDVDRRLRVRIALDGGVHALVQLADVADRDSDGAGAR